MIPAQLLDGVLSLPEPSNIPEKHGMCRKMGGVCPILEGFLDTAFPSRDQVTAAKAETPFLTSIYVQTKTVKPAT